MLAWHYTTGQKFEQISASGMLIPGGIGAEPSGTPVLWFSRNQHWEQTAGDECHETGHGFLDLHEQVVSAMPARRRLFFHTVTI
jgi:hypothetical protein